MRRRRRPRRGAFGCAPWTRRAIGLFETLTYENLYTAAFICRRRRGALWLRHLDKLCPDRLFLACFWGNVPQYCYTTSCLWLQPPGRGGASGVVLAKALFRNSGVQFDLGMQRKLLDILKSRSRFSSGSADDPTYYQQRQWLVAAVLH